MITLSEIENITFRKATLSGGYRSEDVDAFIDEVIAAFEEKDKALESMKAEQVKLRKKVEEYRQNEENIGAALMNAQKQADAIVREANHKAEIVLNEASRKAESIVENTKAEIEEQQNAVLKMQHEISSFKGRLMEIYRQHLTLIGALPSEEEEKKDASLRQEQPAPVHEEAVKEEEVPQEKEKTEPMEETPGLSQSEEAIKEDEKLPEEQPEENGVYEVEPMPQQEEKNGGFQVDTSAFEEEEFDLEDEDEEDEIFQRRSTKFKELEFGEDYHGTKKEGSPIGLFKKRNK